MSKPLAVQKRLYPGVVIRAYKRKGIKAVFKSWSKRHYPNGGGVEQCGCAMTARFCTKKEIEKISLTQIDHVVDKRAKEYGLTDSYFNSFIYGFDGSPRPTIDSNEHLQGYADGEKCRLLVLKHGLAVFN